MRRVGEEILASAEGPIERIGENGFKRGYRFSPDFIGFSGHFPGNPILPAFVQLLVVQSMVEEFFGAQWRMERVRNAKFHIPILPNQGMEVECRPTRVEGGMICEARLTVAEGLATSLTMCFFQKGHAS